MLVYLSLLVFIMLDFALEYFLNKKGILSRETKLAKILNFIFKYRVLTIAALVFVSTFRAVGVSGDSKHYYIYYSHFQNNFEPIYKYEIGYMVLNFILAVVFRFDFRVLFFVISLFISIIFVLFINKFSNNKPLSFFLFVTLCVFFQTLGALRQVIAIGFLILALQSILDNKLWKTIFFIICASLFHVTALICFIIIPAKYIKLNHWWLIGLLAACIVFSIVLPYILQLIEFVFPRIDFYDRYFVKNANHFFLPTNLFNILYSLALITIYIFLYLARFKWFKKALEDDKAFTFFLTLFTIIPLLRIAGFIIGLEALLNRLNMYFFFLLIVLVPKFMSCLKRFNHSGWLYAIVYVGSLAYMILNLVFHDSMQVTPYIFWF